MVRAVSGTRGHYPTTDSLLPVCGILSFLTGLCSPAEGPLYPVACIYYPSAWKSWAPSKGRLRALRKDLHQMQLLRRKAVAFRQWGAGCHVRSDMRIMLYKHDPNITVAAALLYCHVFYAAVYCLC